MPSNTSATPILQRSDETSGWVRRIEGLLRRFEHSGLAEFVHTDRKGAVYNRAFDSAVSVSNTAAVYGTAKKFPQFAKGIDPTVLSEWRENRLAARIKELTENLDITRPSEQAAQGEELIYLLYGTAERRSDIPDNLEPWIQQYCKSWIVREWYRTPSILHLYLAAELFTLECNENESFWSKETERMVRAVAEQVVWRQVAFASSKLWTLFDAAELALASQLSYTAAFPPDVLDQAAQHLNDAAIHDKTWTSRNPRLSAFYACHALLGPSQASKQLLRLVTPAVLSHLQWALDNEPRGTGPWRSPDLRDRYPGPEPWFNCLLIDVLWRAKNWLSSKTRELVLDCYNGEPMNPKVTWENLLLEQIDRDALTRAFVTPVVLDKRSSGELPYCTAILFGPPGTAKTTVAEALAGKLEWPLVQIGVAPFLRDGLERVFARSAEIFHDLLLLDRAVVLLDEVEAVFARREDSQLLQRFLTSALLPPLHALHDRRSIILLIATNHIDAFDGAASRPGRIDLIIPVGPPDAAGRKQLIEHGCKIPGAVAENLAGMMSNGLTIGEILVLKSLSGRDTKDAPTLFKEWRALHGERNLIDSDALSDFEAQTKKYRRVV